jgi:hypothetical protein
MMTPEDWDRVTADSFQELIAEERATWARSLRTLTERTCSCRRETVRLHGAVIAGTPSRIPSEGSAPPGRRPTTASPGDAAQGGSPGGRPLSAKPEGGCSTGEGPPPEGGRVERGGGSDRPGEGEPVVEYFLLPRAYWIQGGVPETEGGRANGGGVTETEGGSSTGGGSFRPGEGLSAHTLLALSVFRAAQHIPEEEEELAALPPLDPACANRPWCHQCRDYHPPRP